MPEAYLQDMDQRFQYRELEEQMLQTSLPSFTSAIAGTILLIYAVHFIAQYFDLAVLSPLDISWNAMVYLLPAPLLLDSARRQELRANDMLAQTHGAKSDALRRMLGLGGNAILQNLPSGDVIGLRGVGRRLSVATGFTRPKVTSAAPAGLGNWDNSCYQNSVLQALCSLDGLKDWLETAEHSSQRDSGSTTNGALQDLMTKLKDVENNGKHIWTPAKLKNMSSWQQQDAQEYFSKVVDELDKEAKKAYVERRQQPGLEQILERDKKGEEQDTIAEDDQATALSNPLEGLVAQRVACTSCGFSEGYSLIPFNCLTVPLGPQFVYNLEDCLDEYTKSEDIEGVECRSCTLIRAADKLQKMIASPPKALNVPCTPIKDSDCAEGATIAPASAPQTMTLPPEIRTQIVARLQAIEKALEDDDFSDKTLKKDCSVPAQAFANTTKTREAMIGRAPQSLVIHINRSVFDEMTGMQRKNYAHVRYPILLDLQPWMLKEGNREALYRLSAVVQHYGRHENGHYIAYRKHDNISVFNEDDEPDSESPAHDQGKEQWWRLSDEDVSPVMEQEVLEQSGAFMLFYNRIREPERPPRMTEAGLEAAAAVPLPRDETEDWDVVSTHLSLDATPSLVTSSAQSEVSESDVDTEIDEPEAVTAVPSAGMQMQQTPIDLKTASPAIKYDMSMKSLSLMSV